MKRFISTIFVAFLLLHISAPFRAMAEEEDWPENISIEADGGILIDADSGTILYGKNIHEKYYPASITKILTALIVIERCDLDETLTFSYEAVHNVEENSSSAGYDTGDTVSVRDALYAMLLKSANEAANALAEHCSGSIEEFAVLMNEKAASLGCRDSNFVNPSGLNNENHYTSAFDFALIAKAAFDNPILREIDSTTYYKLPPTKKTPEGLEIYTHHGMLKKRNENYYQWAVCGKTGYTMLAGHTLVTMGEKEGLHLITVVLNSYHTHYRDTKKMMDFGFDNFKSINISEAGFLRLNTDENINLLGVQDELPGIDTDESSFLVLPKDADINQVDYSINYDLNEAEKLFAFAKIEYTYNNRDVGTTYLRISRPVRADDKAEQGEDINLSNSDIKAENSPDAPPEKAFVKKIRNLGKFVKQHLFVIIVILASALILLFTVLIIRWIIHKRQDDELELLRKERKKQREAMNLNADHLDLSSSSSIGIGLNISKKTRKKTWFFKKR